MQSVVRKKCYLGADNKILWRENLSVYADERGFDKRISFSNGNHIRKIRLRQGTELVRYGANTGHFTTTWGTPYEKLSLPYFEDSMEFHKYLVIADNVTVECIVEEGIVAPGFDQPGGGIQYYHEKNINQCLKNGELEEVFI